MRVLCIAALQVWFAAAQTPTVAPQTPAPPAPAGPTPSGNDLFRDALQMALQPEAPALNDIMPKWAAARRAYRAEGRHDMEADVLHQMGNSLYRAKDFDDAKQAYEEMLKVATSVKDIGRMAKALRDIGQAEWQNEQYRDATLHYEASLKHYHSLRDKAEEAEGLYQLCTIWRYRKDYKTSISYCEKTVKKLKKVAKPDPLRMADIEYMLASNYGEMKDLERSKSHYIESIERFKKSNRFSEAGGALSNLAVTEYRQDRYRESLDHLREGLDLLKKGDYPAMGITPLHNLSNLYRELGEFDGAIEAAMLALDGARKLQGLDDQYGAWIEIGLAAGRAGRLTEAIAAFESAHKMCDATPCGKAEAESLANLGSAYAQNGEVARGLEMSRRAVAIQTKEGTRVSLDTLANAEFRAGNHDQALILAERALQQALQKQDHRVEAALSANLMDIWAAKGSAALAIIYGKQAVNYFQYTRKQLDGLDAHIQKSYLASNESVYRKLGDLLIRQGRLSEAQSVLALLKVEEFQQFVRRDAPVAAGARAELTPAEVALKQGLETKVFEIARQWTDLMAKPTRSAAEDQTLDQMDQTLSAGNADFLKTRDSIADAKAAPDRLRELKQSESMMRALGNFPQGTVAIYTLIADDRLWTILVTPGVERAYEHPIRSADLNRKVFEFRQALQTPAADPRPRAKELYDLLVGGQLADDLKQYNATTLMWSLDGALRYIPMAALYDGSQYLVEKYRVTVFTPGTETLTKPPSAMWNISAFGVTKAHGEFLALPAVEGEVKGVAGVLPGQALLDEQFTAASMRSAFRNNYKVVHIASHFNFQPGDESRSFLLLGDGAHLTLKDLRTQPSAKGIELLALSACNTGLGDGGGDGKEVEGFGMVAQTRFADSVLATLWEVADDSTSLLMRGFYRSRESEAGVSKAEALRRAQLSLIRGETKGDVSSATRGISRPTAATFERDPAAPYAHPYFWAPFFLMGNWL